MVIGKPNNPYQRNLRKQMTESLVRKRIEGTNRIWSQAAVICDTSDGCNDLYARRNRKFVINVLIKSEIFTETVVLNFVTYDQSVDISTITDQVVSTGTTE